MRAVVIADGSAVVQDVPDPVAAPHEVVLRVHGAGLNSADLAQIAGRYPAPPGWAHDIPGLEVAGVVESVGGAVQDWCVGDRALALVGGGGHAERVAIPRDLLLPVGTDQDMMEAAGFAEAFSTAWDAMVDQAGLREGERVLITGAAGGVGTAAVQVGRMVGAEVVASVRSAHLHNQVRSLCPEAEVVHPTDEERCGSYDVVVELAPGPDVLRRLGWLRPYGRLMIIGAPPSPIIDLPLADLMMRRTRVLGTVLRSRPHHEKAALADRIRETVLPSFDAGHVTVPVDSVFDLSDAPAAYERLAASGKFGKVVLRTIAG